MSSKRNALIAFINLPFPLYLTITAHATEALTAGRPAPSFTLQDADGRMYTLAETKGRRMTVLSFFDVESRSRQVGLLMRDELLKQCADKQLTAWSTAQTSRQSAQEFGRRPQLQLHMLLDTAGFKPRDDQ